MEGAERCGADAEAFRLSDELEAEDSVFFRVDGPGDVTVHVQDAVVGQGPISVTLSFRAPASLRLTSSGSRQVAP